jgi:glycerophosphoryl diester phosphodiesterase
MIVIYILLTLAVFLLLAVCATIGRRNHPGLKKLSFWAYAHRGLHGEGVPENSLKAFRRAAAEGYGAELDVHLLADGNLAVIHDSSLKRTAGADVEIEALKTGDLAQYYLEGTFETIPELSKVLEIFQDTAPVVVELKSHKNNCDALCEAACRYLDSYPGDYCIESFDPRCVRWFRKNRPDVLRGQLAENFFKTKDCKLPFTVKLIMSNHLSNFLTMPDFIAYRFSDRNTVFTKICRKLWKVQGVSWTIKTQSDFDTAINEGWLAIFENFNP